MTNTPQPDANPQRSTQADIAAATRLLYDGLIRHGVPEHIAEQARTDIERIIMRAMEKARR